MSSAHTDFKKGDESIDLNKQSEKKDISHYKNVSIKCLHRKNI